MPTPAEPLAKVLDRVWEDQGRIGFLLPASEEIEIRSVEDPVSAVSFRFRWLPHRELRGDLDELEARGQTGLVEVPLRGTFDPERGAIVPGADAGYGPERASENGDTE